MFDVIIHSVVKLPPVKTQPALKYTQQWRISWDQCLFLDWVSKETTNDKHKQNRYCGKLIHITPLLFSNWRVFWASISNPSYHHFRVQLQLHCFKGHIWDLNPSMDPPQAEPKKNTSKKRMMSASFGGERSVPEKNTLWSGVVRGGVWLDFGSFRGRLPNISTSLGDVIWFHVL